MLSRYGKLNMASLNSSILSSSQVKSWQLMSNLRKRSGNRTKDFFLWSILMEFNLQSLDYDWQNIVIIPESEIKLASLLSLIKVRTARRPSMEFIFYKSYVTLELTVCMQTVYNDIVFWLLNWSNLLSQDLKSSSSV
jgi:hypothetical protein